MRSDRETAAASPLRRPRRRFPASLLLGLGLILLSETLLFVDVWMRGGAVIPPPLPEPTGLLQQIGRWAAVNITPLCWVGYLLLLDGLLGWVDGSSESRHLGWASPIRRRPRRFIVCFLASVPIWLFFDWVNFRSIHAWTYHGLPRSTLHRYAGYFFAFGAIVPAMLLTAQLYQRLGLHRLRTQGLRIGRRLQVVLLCLGLVFVALPLLVPDPITTLTLWLGVFLVLVLDPVNHWLGRGKVPTLIGDWQAGRWGRTVSLMAGGLTCGFLWEFWNYWAAAKWVYHLPFLGPLEAVKLFEMPLPGFGGFLPFALECWVAFHAILLVMGWLRLRWFETLPDDDVL